MGICTLSQQRLGQQMSNETTENFWEAFSQPQEQQTSNIFYRLYYDDHGNPLFYSMEDLPGNYIEIDAKTYAEAPSRVRIIKGKLVKNVAPASTKLVPGDQGVACDPRDICVVVDESTPHVKWSLNTYEQN